LIISPQTFSAGQVLATTLADNNLVTGKPLGNKPTGQTGGSALNCPILRRLSRFPIYIWNVLINQNDEKIIIS
jgi:hypothetical protein